MIVRFFFFFFPASPTLINPKCSKLYSSDKISKNIILDMKSAEKGSKIILIIVGLTSKYEFHVECSS